jgi:hypothetical protein
MKRITLTTIAVALATAFFASAALAAPAANRSDPRLDTIASAVAGHPVNVWCEDNATDWGAGPAPTVWGYTYPPPSSNTIHVSPWICMNLHTVLDTTNRDELAMYAVAAAIHTLVHESVHQRGGIYGDCYANGPTDMGCEGRTDCMALTLDVAVAVDYFGFVRTITTRTAATYKWAWQTSTTSANACGSSARSRSPKQSRARNLTPSGGTRRQSTTVCPSSTRATAPHRTSRPATVRSIRAGRSRRPREG